MLLCEVQLGRMFSHNGQRAGKIGLRNGKMDYKWTDAGSINQNLKGVKMVSPNTMWWFLSISLIMRSYYFLAGCWEV